MRKFISHTILIVLSSFTGYADENAQPATKTVYFQSTNKAQTKVHADLKKIKIDKFNITELRVNEAVKKLYDIAYGKKANYSNLVVWTNNKTKINLDMNNTDFTTVLDAICKKSGVSWTIFFYANHLDFPMIGVSSFEKVKEYASLEPPNKPSNPKPIKMQNKAQ
jgi:hypothetical protein